MYFKQDPLTDHLSADLQLLHVCLDEFIDLPDEIFESGYTGHTPDIQTRLQIYV